MKNVELKEKTWHLRDPAWVKGKYNIWLGRCGKLCPTFDTIEQMALHWNDTLFPNQRFGEGEGFPCGARQFVMFGNGLGRSMTKCVLITGRVQYWLAQARLLLERAIKRSWPRWKPLLRVIFCPFTGEIWLDLEPIWLVPSGGCLCNTAGVLMITKPLLNKRRKTFKKRFWNQLHYSRVDLVLFLTQMLVNHHQQVFHCF